MAFTHILKFFFHASADINANVAFIFICYITCRLDKFSIMYIFSPLRCSQFILHIQQSISSTFTFILDRCFPFLVAFKVKNVQEALNVIDGFIRNGKVKALELRVISVKKKKNETDDFVLMDFVLWKCTL